MKVIIRNPKRRELELPGRRRAEELLQELQLNPDSVLVICNGTMVTRDEMIQADDTVEILSAISGG